MKKYAFYTQNGYGAEKFYFEDEKENTVIVFANSWEEAEEKIKKMLDNPKSFEEDGFTAEEVTEENEWKFEDAVYWGEDLGIFEYYSVKFGYEIEIVTETGIGEFDYHSAGIFNNLKEAKELAEELIEEYDKEHTYLHTIFLATRNNKVPEDEDDEETLCDEIAEIKERWTWDNELECYYTTDGYYDCLKPIDF